ncbi:MAG TPA: RDD family protein [Candidatus Limnocylindrales bacterium]|jgi:uncharacterized RDD family membrane protein YckC
MTMAPGFGMEPTAPPQHPSDGPPPPQDVDGPLAPQDARPPSASEPELGSRGLRLIAYILDGLLISFIVGAILIVLVFIAAFLGQTLQSLLLIIGAIITVVISFGYFPFFWSRDGQTLAMMPLGLRVVDEKSGEIISLGRAFLRLFGFFIDSIILGIPFGYLWVFVDSRRRAWHDLIAGTIVIGEK